MMLRYLQKQQWLRGSITESHDCPILKLLGAWEPPVSRSAARVCAVCAALGSRGRLLIGDEEKYCRNEEGESEN